MASEKRWEALVRDIFTDDLDAALRLPGCSLCRVAGDDARTWMETWWREGRNSKDGRQRFYDGGGFCRAHAWLLHEICVVKGSGAAVAAVYGALADRDLALLERNGRSMISPRRGGSPLMHGAACSACVAADDHLGRRAYFLLQLLRSRGARERYVESDGLCFAHLARVVDIATGEDRDLALFLVGDWRRRLRAVRRQLAEFDRKRDHRYADEPKGREQESWTKVIDLYVGPMGHR